MMCYYTNKTFSVHFQYTHSKNTLLADKNSFNSETAPPHLVVVPRRRFATDGFLWPALGLSILTCSYPCRFKEEMKKNSFFFLYHRQRWEIQRRPRSEMM